MLSTAPGRSWGWQLVLATVSALFLTASLAGVAIEVRNVGATSLLIWPYSATITSSRVPRLRVGEVVNLVQLNNITMEDLGAGVVGDASLHVAAKPSPYECLNGATITIFAFHGQLYLHNGLQGTQCTYGTWEIVPVPIAPFQAPVIASVTQRARLLLLSGRNFGSSPGSVVVIGYSATASGPVSSSVVASWSASHVRVTLPTTLRTKRYDVLLVTSSGVAATALATLSLRSPLPGPGLWVQEPSGVTTNLNGVSCVPRTAPTGASTSYCYAVGNFGTILFSANAGRSWAREPSPTTENLNAVTCLPMTGPGVRVPAICYAVGNEGTILFEKNGLPWIVESPTSPPTSQPFLALACESPTRCWAVGPAVAAELTFANPSSPWQLITILGPPGSTCGPGGPPNACLQGVALGNNDEHFAVGGGGNIYAQFDNVGPTWTNQISVGAGYFTSISCGPFSTDGHSHCIAVGTNNSLAASRIYVTFDSGRSWTAATSPPEGALPPLRGVSVLRGALAKASAWAVGDAGTIIHTTDGGTSWTSEASPTHADLLGLACPNTPSLVCLAVGSRGTILARRPATPVSSFAYRATVSASSTPSLVVGRSYNLIHLVNVTLEDLGATVVGRAILHINKAGTPYACLNGSSINLFHFAGQYFLHNGLQGAQCIYGTWEIAPAALASPAQAPVITSAAVAFGPLMRPPAPSARLMVTGRNLGVSPGSAVLIGYSATSSGPVVGTSVISWAPSRVVAGLRGRVTLGQIYDVLLFTRSGAASSILVRVPRIIPLARQTATSTVAVSRVPARNVNVARASSR
jgi:photosystem II stability/assembly factor-like uncharacterized protein